MLLVSLCAVLYMCASHLFVREERREGKGLRKRKKKRKKETFLYCALYTVYPVVHKSTVYITSRAYYNIFIFFYFSLSPRFLSHTFCTQGLCYEYRCCAVARDATSCLEQTRAAFVHGRVVGGALLILFSFDTETAVQLSRWYTAGLRFY